MLRTYLKIHLNTSQWVLPRFDINMLTTSISCPIFGLVMTKTFIKLPINIAYGTLAINSLSSFVCGDWSLDKWKLVAKGVLISLTSPTRLIYFGWDNCKKKKKITYLTWFTFEESSLFSCQIILTIAFSSF